MTMRMKANLYFVLLVMAISSVPGMVVGLIAGLFGFHAGLIAGSAAFTWVFLEILPLRKSKW